MRRRNRFSVPRSSRTPVTQTTAVLKRTSRCAACSQKILAGETAVKVRLGIRFRKPCTSCSFAPKGNRKYHPACLPADLNKAMGYDPSHFNQYAPPPPQQTVAPPPRPPTFEDLALGSLLALEKALAFKRVAPNKVAEVEAALEKYKKIKARALRPGTPAEGEVAVSMAIQQLVKLVFAA